VTSTFLTSALSTSALSTSAFLTSAFSTSAFSTSASSTSAFLTSTTLSFWRICLTSRPEFFSIFEELFLTSTFLSIFNFLLSRHIFCNNNAHRISFVILRLLFILFTFYVSHIYTSFLIFLYSCEKRKWVMLQILYVKEQNFSSSDCTKKVLSFRAKNFHHVMKIPWFFKTVLDLLISN